MDAQAFIERLYADGISLWLDGNAVRYDGPKGSMTDALLAEMRQLKPEIIKLLSSDPPANSESPSYIKRCENCGGTNWGCVGSDSQGDVWGCLTCHFGSEPTCSECGGANIVKDAMGNYCADCKRRPGEAPAKEDQGIHLRRDTL